MSATGLAESLWNEVAKATSSHPDVPMLTLRLADQHAFLDKHGSKLGLHARNIRSIAAPVSGMKHCLWCHWIEKNFSMFFMPPFEPLAQTRDEADSWGNPASFASCLMG